MHDGVFWFLVVYRGFMFDLAISQQCDNIDHKSMVERNVVDFHYICIFNLQNLQI
jgi:hypothetical protein